MRQKSLWALLGIALLAGCESQQRKQAVPARRIGGAFENSSYAYQGMPEKINSVDTSPGWRERGDKILLTGRILNPDETPADGILLYYYQTSVNGRYEHRVDEPRSMPPNSLGQTHGYIRGWVKTDATGRYSIYTVRPGAYPSGDEVAHVHVTVKEPNLNEYYIDDFVFDDDKLLTTSRRRRLENRGGSGIVRLARKGDVQIGERDIFLGRNIPEHPHNPQTKPKGKQVGEDVESFLPFHAWGPDKGTRACPVCKYGWYNGVLYFVGNNPDWRQIEKWLVFLETEAQKRPKYLKVYFIYGNEDHYDKADREKQLASLGARLNLRQTALTFVPSLNDPESEIDRNHIDPADANTFMLYRRSRITAKFTNLPPTQSNFEKIRQSLEAGKNEYFGLGR